MRSVDLSGAKAEAHPQGAVLEESE